jgi:hypothetical protein
MITLPDVSAEMRKWVAGQVRNSQPQNIRASMIGDPCERYIYHSIVDWEKSKPIDAELQGIFELGRALEESIGIPFLKNAGYQIRQPDTRWWKEKHISGRADVSVTRNDLPFKRIPTEMKFLGEYADKYQTWKDMRDSDRRWASRYPGQLLTYMLLHDAEIGLFLTFSKVTAITWGTPFHIWFNLTEDNELLEYGESLLKKAERVWGDIEAKRPSPRVDPKKMICYDCDFLHVCLPPMYFGKEAKVIDNERLIWMLNRKVELEPYSGEYNKLKEELKKILNGIESAICGDWIISGKLAERNGMTVPPFTFWNWKARKVGEEKKGKKKK